MNERPRITIDETELRRCFDAGDLTLPDPAGTFVAGALVELVEVLTFDNVIRVPDGYRLSVLNDDEPDICGLIVEVEARGDRPPVWPLISAGWSDIDNYLPSIEERPEVGSAAEYEALKFAIHAIIGRADRCMFFIDRVRRAFALLGDVALGNSEYDTLSEAASALLAER